MPGSSLPSQGFAYSELVLFVPDSAHSGSSLLARGCARLGFALSASDLLHLGLPLLLHGRAYLGSAMLLPDFSHLEPFISTRSLIWGDFSIPVCGLAYLESSLLAPDSIHLGFPCRRKVHRILEVWCLCPIPYTQASCHC